MSFLVVLVENRRAWFTWWFQHLPGPSICPTRTPRLMHHSNVSLGNFCPRRKSEGGRRLWCSLPSPKPEKIQGMDICVFFWLQSPLVAPRRGGTGPRPPLGCFLKPVWGGSPCTSAKGCGSNALQGILRIALRNLKKKTPLD